MTNRRLAFSWVGLFVLSTAFPTAASVLPEPVRPPWLGLVDVAVAALTALSGFYLVSKAAPLLDQSAEATSYNLIRRGGVVVLLLLFVYLSAPAAVNWSVLIVGLAWRGWLLVAVLPSLIALAARKRSPESGAP